MSAAAAAGRILKSAGLTATEHAGTRKGVEAVVRWASIQKHTVMSSLGDCQQMFW